MRGTRRPPILLTLALCVASSGCAAAQLDLSERQTGAVLTDLSARVEREAGGAKKASDEKPLPKPEPPAPMPAVLALKDALRIAGRQNRDLLSSRED